MRKRYKINLFYYINIDTYKHLISQLHAEWSVFECGRVSGELLKKVKNGLLPGGLPSEGWYLGREIRVAKRG
jgi:hypothetical protein